MYARRLLLSLPAVGLVLAAGVALAQAPAGDPEAGEKVFNQCKACHSIKPGENRVGPSLNGVVGRKAGTAPGFNYSPAMKNSNITWTPEELNAYLTDPKAKVPGNKMAFAGLKKPEDRANVIAYLAHEKAEGSSH